MLSWNPDIAVVLLQIGTTFCTIPEVYLAICYSIRDMKYEIKDILHNTGQVSTLDANLWSYIY